MRGGKAINCWRAQELSIPPRVVYAASQSVAEAVINDQMSNDCCPSAGGKKMQRRRECLITSAAQDDNRLFVFCFVSRWISFREHRSLVWGKAVTINTIIIIAASWLLVSPMKTSEKWIFSNCGDHLLGMLCADTSVVVADWSTDFLIKIKI